jgi:hypothetical protein
MSHSYTALKFRISELPSYITQIDQEKEKSLSEKTDSNYTTENVSFIHEYFG